MTRKIMLVVQIIILIFIVVFAFSTVELGNLAYGALIYMLIDRVCVDIDYFIYGIDRRNVVVGKPKD